MAQAGDAHDNVLRVMEAVSACREPVTALELSRRTGLSKSTVMRVLRALDVKGIVESVNDASHRTRLIYRPRTQGPAARPMPLVDALTTLLALRGATAVWGSLLEPHIGELVAGLETSHKGKWAAVLRTASRLVAPGVRGRVKYEAHHPDVLVRFLEAAGWGCAVRATYRSPWADSERQGSFALARILPVDGALYLVLDDVDRPEQSPHVYALHRFLRAETDRTRRYTADLARADRLLERNADAWVSESRQPVTLRVHRDWVPSYGERQWFPDESIRTEPGGDWIVETTYASEISLFSFVLQHAPWVRIVEPRELDLRLRAHVARIWAE